MRDSRLIEQPVGHEHPLATTIHRVVVRGAHDPDSHRLQIVNDRLGAAHLRAVVVRVRRALLTPRARPSGSGVETVRRRFRRPLHPQPGRQATIGARLGA
jgi:hypothetical protein